MNTKIKEYFGLFEDRMRAFESKKILLMLSGGVDSMVLAYFLLQLKEKKNLGIGCFHLNHMYRGLDADRDAEFVRDFCEKMSLEAHIEARDVPQIAKEKKVGFELCAREVRRAIANDIKERGAYDFIATAHHLDDSVESVLHNFIRGSSLRGLKGMGFKNADYIRPLIDLKKSEIMEIAAYYNIEYREDMTNLDTDFTRNQIRHAIIPEILKINPNFKHTLINSAERMREDEGYLAEETMKAFERIKIRENDLNYESVDIIKMDLTEFRKLHLSIKKRLIRLIIEKIRGNLVDVYSSAVNEIISLSDNDNAGKQIEFKNIIFEVSRDKMLIAPLIEDELEERVLSLGENTYNGARILVKTIDYDTALDYESNRKGENAYIILPEKYLHEQLILRRRKAGDYIKPKRLKGKKKSLKKLYIDYKLSRIEKARQIVLSKNDEILWALGLEKIDNIEMIEKYKNEKFLLMELFNL